MRKCHPVVRIAFISLLVLLTAFLVYFLLGADLHLSTATDVLYSDKIDSQVTFAVLTMIVSRGLAKDNTVVPRIYNPPELVLVSILPASREVG